jgi:hypothetical protein
LCSAWETELGGRKWVYSGRMEVERAFMGHRGYSATVIGEGVPSWAGLLSSEDHLPLLCLKVKRGLVEWLKL